MLTRAVPLLRRLAESDRFADVLRVLLALAGITAWCTLRGPADAIVPALLGAIGCALAETDDAWRGRLRGVVVTLLCFAVAAGVVEVTLPYPPLFALLLPLGAFVLVMLGAASGRYATIATATLILAVYTMIASDTRPASGVASAGAILAGAAWYGVLSLAWSALSPQRAVRHALSRLFDSLADLMEARAAQFEPVRDLDRPALDLAFARRNQRTVAALSDARAALIDRIGRRQPRGRLAARLAMFFTAQDIHERISSSHYPYDELAAATYHSDVMFRVSRLLRLQAQGCRERAHAIRRLGRLRSMAPARTTLDDLHEAIVHHRQTARPDRAVDEALHALMTNLQRLQALIENEGVLPADADVSLHGLEPGTLREAWQRVRVRLTPRSMHFRHAVRLAAGMLAGYLVMLALHPLHGYWILLTTLFVCQPSYGGTRRRVVQRVAGTTLGLLVGWALLRALPGGDWRLPVLVASGAGFFAFRFRRYTEATAVITLFVLLCFDRAGTGYDAIAPRLLDTLLGACVAIAAIRYVLPDWRVRRLDDMASDALDAYARYLDQIGQQYERGRADDLPYRIARRDAHAAAAAVAGNVTELLAEPGHPPQRADRALRLLGALQNALSHLSTLGTHRQVLPVDEVTRLHACVHGVTDNLRSLARALRLGEQPAERVRHAEAPASETASAALRLIEHQCALLHRLCDRIAGLPPA